jgi:hypothetical protein
VQVARAAVDLGRFGSVQRMLPKVALVQPDAGDPTEDHRSVLQRRDRPISTARIRPGFIGGCGIIFDRLSRMETHPSSRVEHEVGEP